MRALVLFTLQSKLRTNMCRMHTLSDSLDFIILCLFCGNKLGSPVTSGVTRRQSRVCFVDCKGIFTPHTSYLGTKKYHSFTKSRTCGGLKKTPSSTKYVTRVPPPRATAAAGQLAQCVTFFQGASIIRTVLYASGGHYWLAEQVLQMYSLNCEKGGVFFFGGGAFF